MYPRNKILVLYILAAVFFFGCNKDKGRIPANYVSKLAGTHTMYGRQYITSTFLPLDSTFDCSIKINIVVIDNSTIVTSKVDNGSILPAYASDTLHLVDANAPAHTVVFEYSQNIIDAGAYDVLIFNYADNTIQQMQNNSSMTGSMNFDIHGQ